MLEESIESGLGVVRHGDINKTQNLTGKQILDGFLVIALDSAEFFSSFIE